MNLLIKDYLPTFRKENKQNVIVIDPGHGGNDPGKVGVNNALEKDINLAIAMKLKPYFEEHGFKVIMTRDSDNALYQESASNKKRSDLQARVKLCNENNPLLVISIHQNSYQTADCKGAQVFYYDTSTQGEILAELIQQSLIMNVDSNNSRKIKANKNYFLLKEINTTAVIVECGFLSNPEEAEQLIQDEYQEKVAVAIYAGVIAFLENKQADPENNKTEDKEIENIDKKDTNIDSDKFQEIKSIEEYTSSNKDE